jgi:cytochrome c biogenesis protein CcmG/thiol:disulfide interchange protein DsbE
LNTFKHFLNNSIQPTPLSASMGNCIMRYLVSFIAITFFSMTLLVPSGVQAKPDKPIEARLAPDFSLKMADGTTVKLADYKGKPLVLHFWATWCPYCKKLQPGLDALYQKYQPQGLEMLSVSIWEDDGATPQAVLDARGSHFKTALFGDDITKAYGVKGTPTTLFISREGKIIAKTGKSDPKNPALEKAIKQIMKP